MSAETLRRRLREGGQKGQRKRKPYRQRRGRRAYFGDLVQMDGSIYLWLEERGERGSQMHLVDEATSTADGRFYPEETIWEAAGCCGDGSRSTGPRALDTDWKNVCVREATVADKQQEVAPLTQFARRCRRLGYASSICIRCLVESRCGAVV